MSQGVELTARRRRVPWRGSYLLAQVTPVVVSTAVWIVLVGVQPILIIVGPVVAAVWVTGRRHAAGALRTRDRVPQPTTWKRRGLRASPRVGATMSHGLTASYCVPWGALIFIGSRVLGHRAARAGLQMLRLMMPALLAVAIGQQASVGAIGTMVGVVAVGVLIHTIRMPGGPMPRVFAVSRKGLDSAHDPHGSRLHGHVPSSTQGTS